MAAVTFNNNVFSFLNIFRQNLKDLEVKREIRGESSDYKDIKSSWTQGQLEDILKAGYDFLEKFEEFLQNGDYTNQESDYQFVKLYFEGLSDNEIIKELNLENTNSLRSKRSRLTRKVYRRLFDQKTVPTALIYVKDLKTIQYYLSLLTSANVNMSFENIMLAGTHSAIRELIKDIKPDGRLNDSEYSLALRLIAMYSKEEFRKAIEGVEPKALAYVLKELKSAKSNKTSIAFNSLKSVFLSSVDDFEESSLSIVRAFENKDSEYIDTSKPAEISANWKRLKEEENRLLAKEAELAKLEADINKKMIIFQSITKFICQNFEVSSTAEFKTLVETAKSLNIPVEYLKIALDYQKKYDYELSTQNNRFQTYKGDLNITSDTKELVEKLFASIKLNNFKDKVSVLNPYNISVMLKSGKN